MDRSKITDWVFPSQGLIRAEALSQYVNQQVGGRTMEQMRLPLGVVATDLASGEPIVFRRGDTGLAGAGLSHHRAEVFQPVKIGSRGTSMAAWSRPMCQSGRVHEMGAEFVIAVDISSAPRALQHQGHLGRHAPRPSPSHGQGINRHEAEGGGRGGAAQLARGVQRGLHRPQEVDPGRPGGRSWRWPELQRKLATKQIPGSERHAPFGPAQGCAAHAWRIGRSGCRCRRCRRAPKRPSACGALLSRQKEPGPGPGFRIPFRFVSRVSRETKVSRRQGLGLPLRRAGAQAARRPLEAVVAALAALLLTVWKLASGNVRGVLDRLLDRLDGVVGCRDRRLDDGHGAFGAGGAFFTAVSTRVVTFFWASASWASATLLTSACVLVAMSYRWRL